MDSRCLMTSCWCCRFVTQLLTDVIYFVSSQENTGSGDPLDISVSKPDRERQKLLREQNILKQVGDAHAVSSLQKRR